MQKRSEVYGTMLAPDVAEARLRETGSRMTAQRRAVLDILHENRTHPVAEAIVSEVRNRLGYVSQATVYNTLDTLEALGFVRRVAGLERQTHFDPDTSDHQHAICRKCRRVWDIECSQDSTGLPESFRVENILIQGVCEDCA